MKLDIPEQTEEKKAADFSRLKSQLEDQVKRAAMRQFDTHAPLPAAVLTDPLEVQLLVHFRTLTAYGKKIAVAQLSSLSTLCKHCTKE